MYAVDFTLLAPPGSKERLDAGQRPGKEPRSRVTKADVMLVPIRIGVPVVGAVPVAPGCAILSSGTRLRGRVRSLNHKPERCVYSEVRSPRRFAPRDDGSK
jgi:hypothetical protein